MTVAANDAAVSHYAAKALSDISRMAIVARRRSRGVGLNEVRVVAMHRMRQKLVRLL